MIQRPEVLRELAPGEWLLGANLRIEAGAVLRIAAPNVRWLKLRSDDQVFVWIRALGGQLAFADPASGLSFAYLTNGLDRHLLRQGRRGTGIASRAIACASSD